MVIALKRKTAQMYIVGVGLKFQPRGLASEHLLLIILLHVLSVHC